MTVTLPQQFQDTMRELLAEEYQDYIKSMEEPSHTALRVNTHKISLQEFAELCPFASEPVAWEPKGFYYDSTGAAVSKHPYYYAGLYYIQEPSAMIPAKLLPVEKGDRVLDLCAAPGGKATELASKLDGSGILVANDISVSRAMALAKNLQVAGTTNAVVTAETPEKLADTLPEFFDKVLIDAPCSGEGMFRRDPSMVKSWLAHGPEYYVPIQTQILEQAYRLLAAGGDMVYSTCTFSPLEDEGMIQSFLDRHPDMMICDVERCPGYSEGMPEWIDGGDESLRKCVRIFPHRAGGEGHFAVLLHKAGDPDEKRMTLLAEETGVGADGKRITSFADETGVGADGKCITSFADETGNGAREENTFAKKGKGRKKKSYRRDEGRDRGKGDRRKRQEEPESFFKSLSSSVPFTEKDLSRKKDTYLIEALHQNEMKGLRMVSGGLIFGTDKNGRFEPSAQLALAMRQEDYVQRINLTASDERAVRYLKGETILSDCMDKGYVLVCVDGFPLGWCKGNGSGTLKNKYYPGWRMQ